MAIRCNVEPRDVPLAAAARRLGIDQAEFATRLPELIARGFPAADSTTGNFDLKAIDFWMDRRSGLSAGATPFARDATSVVAARIKRMRHG